MAAKVHFWLPLFIAACGAETPTEELIKTPVAGIHVMTSTCGYVRRDCVYDCAWMCAGPEDTECERDCYKKCAMQEPERFCVDD